MTKSINLSIYLSIYLSFCVYLSLSLCLCVSVCLCLSRQSPTGVLVAGMISLESSGQRRADTQVACRFRLLPSGSEDAVFAGSCGDSGACAQRPPCGPIKNAHPSPSLPSASPPAAGFTGHSGKWYFANQSGVGAYFSGSRVYNQVCQMLPSQTSSGRCSFNLWLSILKKTAIFLECVG